MPAPIAFFAYNRPFHTKQTLEALALCEGAQDSEVFFFCDGPRPNETDEGISAIEEVRALIQAQTWPKAVHLHFQTKNIGLAASITGGLSHVLEAADRVIVIEDDLVVGKGFLTYLNVALEHYQNEERVMHIAAYIPPIDPAELPTLYFYGQASCWGWATWKRAWKAYNGDARMLKAKIEERGMVDAFNIDNSYNFMRHLEKNIDGKLNTWAIKWQASVILSGGLCLHPSRSLVRNIGADGTGAHMKKEEAEGMRGNITDQVELNFPKTLTENTTARGRIAAHYRSERKRLEVKPPTLAKRIQNRIKNLLS